MFYYDKTSLPAGDGDHMLGVRLHVAIRHVPYSTLCKFCICLVVHLNSLTKILVTPLVVCHYCSVIFPRTPAGNSEIIFLGHKTTSV